MSGGIFADLDRAIRQKIDDEGERGVKIVPVVIAQVDPTVTVKIQGSTVAHPAVFEKGQWGPVGSSAYALWLPGSVIPLVFFTEAIPRAPINQIYDATSADTTSLTNNAITTITTGWTGNAVIGTAGTAGAYFSSFSAGAWTIAVAGNYHLNCSITYAAGAQSRRGAFLYLNGSELRRHDVGNGSTGAATVQVEHWATLAIGDVITVRAFQASGGALALGSAPGHRFQALRAV